MGDLLRFFQDKMIFRPKKLPAGFEYDFDIPFREINIPLKDEKNINIIQFLVPVEDRKGIVLYFHGNRGNISRHARHADQFTRNGYATWMIDYPGYGKSTGLRNEQVLYEDALHLYNLAIEEVSADNIIIYGRSLGSGIAAQLASIRDCRMLILETPYYSMAKLSAYYFPVLPDRFFGGFELPTVKYLEKISGPVIIFHGTKDRIVPYKHAEWLKEKVEHIELITIENGKHNNLSEFALFHEKIDSLLK